MLRWVVPAPEISGAPRARRPRADVLRNTGRIVDAAAELLAQRGPEVALEEIAARAGVGIATLYRHFSGRDELMRAVVRRAFAVEVTPELQVALTDGADARAGLVRVLEAAVRFSQRHRTALVAAKRPGAVPFDLARTFFGDLARVLARAQAQGSVRADLGPEDLPILMKMTLVSTLWSDEEDDGWQRYLALLLDALSPAAATSLPARVRRLARHSPCRVEELGDHEPR
jgi:AcrR family transcriptional regulator